MPDNPTCATCRWWRPDAQQCRRHAPVVVPTNEGCRYHTEWPGVSSYDWCGEHAPRVEARRCRMHPDRITDGALFCGHPLCGDCWTEEIIAEQDGVLIDFKKKILNGPESTDASV